MWLLLKADPADERAWLKLFKPPFDPHVELLPHDSGDQVLVLKAAELDDLATVKSAYNVGEGIVRTLNGLAAGIIGESSVELDGVAEMRAGKLVCHKIMPAETAHFSFGGGSAEFQVIVRDHDGNIVVPPPAPTAAQSRYAASRKSGELTYALNYCAGESGWFELYKAMECLERAGFIRRNDNEMVCFARTANALHRHHEGKIPPPTNPMSLRNARLLLRARINQALDKLAKRT